MNIPTLKQIVIRITVIIAVIELAIMMVFQVTNHNLGPFTEALLDVILLVVLSTPMIYFWVIKPYVVQHEKVVIQTTHMAYHDPLTQLANRHLLSEFSTKLISNHARNKLYGALLVIDLDGFKLINDKYGHDAGDAVLIEIGTRLKSLVRIHDIVSRLGGDEFVVVLGQLAGDEQSAHNSALLKTESIAKALRKTILFNDMELQIDSSIGLRLLTPQETSIESIIKDADTAMYKAKQAGKGNIVVFEPASNVINSNI